MAYFAAAGLYATATGGRAGKTGHAVASWVVTRGGDCVNAKYLSHNVKTYNAPRQWLRRCTNRPLLLGRATSLITVSNRVSYLTEYAFKPPASGNRALTRERVRCGYVRWLRKYHKRKS